MRHPLKFASPCATATGSCVAHVRAGTWGGRGRDRQQTLLVFAPVTRLPPASCTATCGWTVKFRCSRSMPTGDCREAELRRVAGDDGDRRARRERVHGDVVGPQRVRGGIGQVDAAVDERRNAVDRSHSCAGGRTAQRGPGGIRRSSDRQRHRARVAWSRCCPRRRPRRRPVDFANRVPPVEPIGLGCATNRSWVAVPTAMAKAALVPGEAPDGVGRKQRVGRRAVPVDRATVVRRGQPVDRRAGSRCRM